MCRHYSAAVGGNKGKSLSLYVFLSIHGYQLCKLVTPIRLTLSPFPLSDFPTAHCSNVHIRLANSLFKNSLKILAGIIFSSNWSDFQIRFAKNRSLTTSTTTCKPPCRRHAKPFKELEFTGLPNDLKIILLPLKSQTKWMDIWELLTLLSFFFFKTSLSNVLPSHEDSLF